MPEYSDIALYPPIFGGFGSGVVRTDAVAPTKAVKEADPVERSGFLDVERIGGLGQFLGCGQYPGYPAGPVVLSDAVCAVMRHHPIVELVGSKLIEPVLSPASRNTVEIAWDGGQPKRAEEVKAAAEFDLLPFLQTTKPGGMESLFWGRWLMELVWAESPYTGRTLPVGCPSVTPFEGQIYVDKFNQFAGYRVGGHYRDGRYGLLIVNDPHINPVLGRSPLQTALASWWRALRSSLNADAVERKASGIQMLAYVMQGVHLQDKEGKQVDVMDFVEGIVRKAMAGQSAVLPVRAFKNEDIAENPDLAKSKLVDIDRFDWGDLGGNLNAHGNRLRDLHIQMINSFGVSDRAVMEAANHGGFADAIPASDAALDKSERLHASHVRQFDAQVTPRWQRANFPGFKGAIRITTAPMTDQRRRFREQLILAVMSNKDAGPKLLPHIDERRLLEADGVPLKPVEVVEQEKKEAADAAAKVAADMAKSGQQQGAAAQTDRAAKAAAGPDGVQGTADDVKADDKGASK